LGGLSGEVWGDIAKTYGHSGLLLRVDSSRYLNPDHFCQLLLKSTPYADLKALK
jgi:hypothetical protein